MLVNEYALPTIQFEIIVIMNFLIAKLKIGNSPWFAILY